MNKNAFIGILLCLIPSFVLGKTISFKNDKYTVVINQKGGFNITNNATKAETNFNGDFAVNYTDKNPKVSFEPIIINGDIDNILYRTLAWNKEKNLFNVGNINVQQVQKVVLQKNKVVLQYAKTAFGNLSATLELPIGNTEPLLTFEYRPIITGYFSIGYCGAPAKQINEVEEIWQPLIWTQKRFPGNSYLTPDYLCSMPLSALKSDGVTYGVIVDPTSFPFNPLPTNKDFTFGVAIRNEQGNAQPMVWAPILGSKMSEMQAGSCYSFKLRFYVNKKSISEMHEDVALNLYGLKDYSRTNETGSLNATLDRMIEYGMSEYSWFVKELKGCSYETDVKNSVKNTSAINPLDIALVTDDEEVFNERFIPMFEYMLSRDNLLFSLERKVGEDGQIPSSRLGKPIMNASEAIAIYDITSKQSKFLINNIFIEKMAKSPSPKEKSWREQLALYLSTQQQKYLSNATTGANQYISETVDATQSSFDYKNHSKSSFWTQLSPKFPELYNLYETTKDTKYLFAARKGAREYAQFIWMCPAIPPGQTTVNIGGVAPQQKKWGQSMQVPEETVDNWRLSEIGLHCECAATSNSHRAVFPAHYAAYMLKIASHTNDTLLKKIANWAIVGRYANFPGYHINTARTTAYEKENFPLKSHLNMNVNSMHYNHIWPQMSILLDYMISDVYDKSKYSIYFPSVATEAFVNLGSNAYGHLSGEFYGEKVQLWMPRHLLETQNKQLNYVAARKDKTKLYIAFSNQSTEKITTSIELNNQFVTTKEGSNVRMWKNNKIAEHTIVKNGTIDIEVVGNGITAICIDDVSLNVKFQDKLLASSIGWNTDYKKGELGRGMLISMGGLPRRFFAYAACANNEYKSVVLRYSYDGKTFMQIEDNNFPFEFSFPVDDSIKTIYYQLKLINDGGMEKTEEINLLKK